MKKVISYCLFGDNPRYTIGAIKNAFLAQVYMPEWECRFYYHNTSEHVIDILKQFDNVNLINQKQRTDMSYTLTRFLVLADPEVDVAIIRDTDARISAREIRAVEEWLESDFDFHIMKDHPVGHSYAISAGMFGVRNGALSMIKELLEDFFDSIKNMTIVDPGVDQRFLGEMVYPIIKDKVLIHSEHYNVELSGKSEQLKFPTEDRYPQSHIGAALDANDNYLYDYDIEQSDKKKYQYDFDLLEKNSND